MYFVIKILYKYLQILNRIIPLRYKIIFSVIVVALIYDFYTANPVTTTVFFSLFLLECLLIWGDKAVDKKQKKLMARKFKVYTSNRSQKNHGIMVDTKGGNYNERVEGNYIEGDFGEHLTFAKTCVNEGR